MKEKLGLLICSLLTFWSCTYLIIFGVHPIIASALLGLISTFLSKKVSLIVYCVSFSAIGAGEISNSYMTLSLIPLFSIVIFMVMKNSFIGMGGKLGMIAFVGSGLVYNMVKLL